MHGVGDEEGERPSAADERAGEDAVAVAPLKINAGAEYEEADRIAESNFCRIAERGEFVGQKERNADDQRDDAELVEPVFTKRLFDL